MDSKVIYIADLDQDVDDVIAAEYLHRKGALKEVVCDPIPVNEEGKERKRQVEGMGIKVSNKIPSDVKCVFCGGALTALASYLANHKIDTLVMNGGFVGANIVECPLEKFKRKQTVRTYNFNYNVNATDTVLKSPNIGHIVLVGKNVCHSEKNTLKGIWRAEKDLLEKHHVRPDKRLHDLLACHEGLIRIGLLKKSSYLRYKAVCPYNNGLKGIMTEWGSTFGYSPYREVIAAIGWRDDYENSN